MITYVKEKKDDGRISIKDMEEQIILAIVMLKHNPTFEMLIHLLRISKTKFIDYFSGLPQDLENLEKALNFEMDVENLENLEN